MCKDPTHKGSGAIPSAWTDINATILAAAFHAMLGGAVTEVTYEAFSALVVIRAATPDGMDFVLDQLAGVVGPCGCGGPCSFDPAALLLGLKEVRHGSASNFAGPAEVCLEYQHLFLTIGLAQTLLVELLARQRHLPGQAA